MARDVNRTTQATTTWRCYTPRSRERTCNARSSECGPTKCVFRKSVTDRFGIVTAEFGNVTEHFGDVTDGSL
jgi:hypothetical protein